MNKIENQEPGQTQKKGLQEQQGKIAGKTKKAKKVKQRRWVRKLSPT